MLKMSRILCASKTSYTKTDLLCFGAFRLFYSFIFSDGGPAGSRGDRLKRRFARHVSEGFQSLLLADTNQTDQEQMRENIRDRIWKGHRLGLSLNSGRSSCST